MKELSVGPQDFMPSSPAGPSYFKKSDMFVFEWAKYMCGMDILVLVGKQELPPQRNAPLLASPPGFCSRPQPFAQQGTY